MTSSDRNQVTGRADGAVFISYHHASGSAIADFVETYLRAGGIVPWRDVRDLEAGQVARSIEDAFAEGLSGAVLVVTDGIEQSSFVPEEELPLILDAHAPDSSVFQLHVVNTIRKEGSDELDTEAPERMLQDKCPRPVKLAKNIQRALLRRRDAEESAVNELGVMLCALLRHRLAGWPQGKVLAIGVQTRPFSSHYAASTHTPHSGDLHIRLHQDHQTNIPEELDLHCLKEALPKLIDVLHEQRISQVRFQGGCHPSLAWALGASLPKSRPEITAFMWRDNDGLDWSSTDQPEQVTTNLVLQVFNPGDETGKQVTREQLCDALQFTGDRKDVVVLLAGNQPNLQPLRALADRLGAPAVVIEFDAPENQSGRKLIPHTEGALLAHQAGLVLRDLYRCARLHVAVSVPVALAALIARETNTTVTDFYELATFPGNTKRYIPVLRTEPGANSPICGVFAQRVPQIDAPRTLRNLTPHAVTIIPEVGAPIVWAAPESDDQWVRRQEASEGLNPLHVDGHEISLARIRQGSIHPDPPMIPGVGYIVPRISAEAARRPDFFFPHGEVRGDGGTIVGCRGLGSFGAVTDRTRLYLDWVKPISEELP